MIPLRVITRRFIDSNVSHISRSTRKQQRHDGPRCQYSVTQTAPAAVDSSGQAATHRCIFVIDGDSYREIKGVIRSAPLRLSLFPAAEEAAGATSLREVFLTATIRVSLLSETARNALNGLVCLGCRTLWFPTATTTTRTTRRRERRASAPPSTRWRRPGPAGRCGWPYRQAGRRRAVVATRVRTTTDEGVERRCVNVLFLSSAKRTSFASTPRSSSSGGILCVELLLTLVNTNFIVLF